MKSDKTLDDHTYTELTLTIFVNAVKELRELQKRYFAARRAGNPNAKNILTLSIAAEKEVDSMIQSLTSPKQPNLFDQQ
jgi:hypothetical protein